jgi:DedD protein
VDNILKQRLVGALILLALGVVFWPIVFVQPDASQPLGDPARVPQRPDINSSPIAPASAEGLRTSPTLNEMDQAVDQSASFDESAPIDNIAPAVEAPTVQRVAMKARSDAPVKPTVDADGVPIGWILQVASITSADKAEQLRVRLLAMGYKAYVKKIRSANSVLMRVYVGPKFERSKLEAMQAAIDTEFSVKSMVRRYIP